MCLWETLVCMSSLFSPDLFFSDYFAMYGPVYWERNKIQVKFSCFRHKLNEKRHDEFNIYNVQFFCCQRGVWLHSHSLQRRRRTGLLCVSLSPLRLSFWYGFASIIYFYVHSHAPLMTRLHTLLNPWGKKQKMPTINMSNKNYWTYQQLLWREPMLHITVTRSFLQLDLRSNSHAWLLFGQFRLLCLICYLGSYITKLISHSDP